MPRKKRSDKSDEEKCFDDIRDFLNDLKGCGCCSMEWSSEDFDILHELFLQLPLGYGDLPDGHKKRT